MLVGFVHLQSGRCTLEAAVRLVESSEEWNAKVVYGDTDSLFVLLKGRSKADAFRIGQEIADAVTGSNPKCVCVGVAESSRQDLPTLLSLRCYAI